MPTLELGRALPTRSVADVTWNMLHEAGIEGGCAMSASSHADELVGGRLRVNAYTAT